VFAGEGERGKVHVVLVREGGEQHTKRSPHHKRPKGGRAMCSLLL
jgi:hypothetical protein